MSVFVRVFFFQAEDGIRDTSVTGVQTCALPILRRRASSKVASWAGVNRLGSSSVKGSRSIAARKRSEERRVGKECRSRWWRHHARKKRGKRYTHRLETRSTRAQRMADRRTTWIQ